MDHNWPYVAAGYGLTFAAVGSYVVWLQARLRRVRRNAPDRVELP